MAVFEVKLKSERIRLDIHVPMSDLESCKSAARVFRYTGARPSDWQLQFYRIFLDHPSTLRLSKEIVNALQREVANEAELVQWAIVWVQEGIRYDHSRAAGKMEEGIQFPVETVNRGLGVCSDKSLLLASVLLQLGYGVGFFTFNRANHMAVGIQAPAGCGAFGTHFAFLETTQVQTPGIVPERMAGGVRLDGRPDFWLLKQGKTFQDVADILNGIQAGIKEFGKDFAYMTDTQRDLKQEMQRVQAKMDQIKPKLSGCHGTLPPDRFHACRALNAEYNALVAEYNALVVQFNASNR